MPQKNIHEGFVYVTNYSSKFRKVIQALAEAAERVIPSKDLKGIGIFLFGSPSRQEMIDESDADIMIIRESDTKDYETFRSEFMNLIEKERFSKIDVPEWGTFEDCELYLKFSIVEGNQVAEAKFIYGDESVNKFIESLKEKYITPHFFERVLCFQKLYFDQYYTQRTKQGAKNVKYGHGGTRDFMFVTLFSNLLDVSESKRINVEDNFPLIYKSLGSLYERKLISLENYSKYRESIDVVLILRNEILMQNRWTASEGLTYLDEQTARILLKRKLFLSDHIIDIHSLQRYLEGHMSNVEELKQRLWRLFIEHMSKTKGLGWTKVFNIILSGKITREIMDKIEGDEILQTILIWNLNHERDAQMFYYAFKKYSLSNEWMVLASLCCHRDCPPEVLDIIAKTSAIKRGYEYLLRIISRNKNVFKETLKGIIECSFLEERYKIVSQIAYEKGVDKANELR